MELEGKKVAVLGLGVENLPLSQFLIKEGADVTICDKNPKAKDQRLKTESWRLGKDYLDNLSDFEIIFRTPGLPVNTKELIESKKKGVEVSSATKLFFNLCPAKIIGVTGTKGKGTTAALIYEILKRKSQIPNPKFQTNSKSKIQNSKIYLAGNIGTPAMEVISKIKPQDWVILELSSFQLQDLEKSPHIAVVLNVFPDHLDYHASFEEHIKAKQNIVRHQKSNDFAVINADYESSRSFAKETKAKVIWFSKREKPKWLEKMGLLGEHNLENICAAIAVASSLGVDKKIITKVVADFKGLPHRLEFVKEINGVRYINDSYSTTPETTIAAIESFPGPIILILGGREKGGDYNMLVDAIETSSVKSVILIGEMARRLNSKFQIPNSKQIKNLKFAKMDKIVEVAKKEVRTGDIVLFSPGAASFDMFKNAGERGEQFKKAVLTIKK